MLSPHFSLRELTVSETAPRAGIDNTPSAAVVENLRRLCAELLEPIRLHFGPLRITSGYRCPELNRLIGGSPTSRHPDGLAADLHPLVVTVTLAEVVEWIRTSTLPFDQVIYEYGQWVHVGAAAVGERPRREALMRFRDGWHRWNVLDQRVLDAA